MNFDYNLVLKLKQVLSKQRCECANVKWTLGTKPYSFHNIGSCQISEIQPVQTHCFGKGSQYFECINVKF